MQVLDARFLKQAVFVLSDVEAVELIAKSITRVDAVLEFVELKKQLRIAVSAQLILELVEGDALGLGLNALRKQR